MEEPRFPFFTNKECENFPCHEGIDENQFNCAFCYCPLYALGAECGGDFVYTDKGIKSCHLCVKPHCGTQGIDLVAEHWDALRDMTMQ